jgi:predicted transcriptional regulator
VAKETLTVRVDTRRRDALDQIASGLDRDRSYVLNEAIAAYIDAHHWQIEHIKKGLKQAEAGKFASDREVKKAFAGGAGEGGLDTIGARRLG